MDEKERRRKVADKLKRLRLEAPKEKISAREFGDRIGYSQSYISALENNQKSTIPSKEVLNKFSSVYAELGYNHAEVLNELFVLAGYENVTQVDSLIELFSSSTLNGFNQKKNGIVAYSSYEFPINDLFFHLSDKYNKKMFKTVFLTDYDREYITKMIQTYLLHKLENRKGDYSDSIEALKKEENIFNTEQDE